MVKPKDINEFAMVTATAGGTSQIVPGLPAFQNRVLQPRARLLLADGDYHQTSVLTCNRPVRFKGYGIFLKDFAPRKKGGGMSGRIRIDMSIRKDPGLRFYMAGILLFTAGLSIYLVEWIFYKKVKKADQ